MEINYDIIISINVDDVHNSVLALTDAAFFKVAVVDFLSMAVRRSYHISVFCSLSAELSTPYDKHH